MSSSGSSVSDPLDARGEEDYEDVEPDQEKVEFVGLFDETTYSDIQSLLKDTKEKHGFDLLDTQKKLGLEFYELIKLVNYIRSEVKAQNTKPDVSSKEKFSDDKYLQPVLEDDALLFSIDELADTELVAKADESLQSLSKDDLVTKVSELEEKLQRLAREYSSYKEVAEKTLDERWNAAGDVPAISTQGKVPAGDLSEVDKGYFSSYSFSDIHESMIKDSVRTNAYRDFIEKNADLIRGKIILDIGCGSGILSLFCARAGAARVIAVDNSDIINTARLIIHANGYDDKITCVRGKIEEITLPVPQVDVIVSEWMGYALFFEGMWDSVLWARDRYLKPGGLMAPSHCSLHIAAVKNDKEVEEKRKFWKDVYGFNMTPMIQNDKFNEENIAVEYFNKEDVARTHSDIITFDAHKATVADLSFKDKFAIELQEDVESIPGWLIWFDILFERNSTAKVTKSIQETAVEEGLVWFTTGPYGPATHWKCAYMPTDKLSTPLKKGTKVTGSVEYAKGSSSDRALDVTIEWEVEGSTKKSTQKWNMS